VLKKLALLVDRGWLNEEKAEPARRGQPRRASAYAVQFPQRDSHDRSAVATGRMDNDDRSAQSRRPVGSTDPKSSEKRPETSGDDQQSELQRRTAEADARRVEDRARRFEEAKTG
jgi:hypothetical protein